MHSFPREQSSVNLPSSVILQASSNPKIQREESLIRAHAQVLGVPVREVSPNGLKDVFASPWAGQMPVGSLPFIEAALKTLKVPVPKIDQYPKVLEPMLHRAVWESTLHEIKCSFEQGKRRKPVFIKPLNHAKLFRGRVVYSDLDAARLPYPAVTKLWCCDVVRWIAEWRCYVLDGTIRDTRCYMVRGKAQKFYSSTKDPEIEPDKKEMIRAVKALVACGFARSTFTIDFGLLSTGQIALIELDDAYSVGAYGISGCDYFEFLWKGWLEIIK